MTFDLDSSRVSGCSDIWTTFPSFSTHLDRLIPGQTTFSYQSIGKDKAVNQNYFGAAIESETEYIYSAIPFECTPLLRITSLRRSLEFTIIYPQKGGGGVIVMFHRVHYRQNTQCTATI